MADDHPADSIIHDYHLAWLRDYHRLDSFSELDSPQMLGSVARPREVQRYLSQVSEGDEAELADEYLEMQTMNVRRVLFGPRGPGRVRGTDDVFAPDCGFSHSRSRTSVIPTEEGDMDDSGSVVQSFSGASSPVDGDLIPSESLLAILESGRTSMSPSNEDESSQLSIQGFIIDADVFLNSIAPSQATSSATNLGTTTGDQANASPPSINVFDEDDVLSSSLSAESDFTASTRLFAPYPFHPVKEIERTPAGVNFLSSKDPFAPSNELARTPHPAGAEPSGHHPEARARSDVACIEGVLAGLALEQAAYVAEYVRHLENGVVFGDFCEYLGGVPLPLTCVLAFPCPPLLARRLHAHRWTWAVVFLAASLGFALVAAAFACAALGVQVPVMTAVRLTDGRCAGVMSVTVFALFVSCVFWTQVDWAHGNRSTAVLFPRRLLFA